MASAEYFGSALVFYLLFFANAQGPYSESTTQEGTTTSCRNVSCEDCDGDCGDLCRCCPSELMCSDPRLQFMTAAQIALGAALLVAITALAVLVWKMCYRSNMPVLPRGDRVRALCGLSPTRRRTSSGGTTRSASSLQNFVIQKMRDRPPRYDDAPPEMPPNYESVVTGTEGGLAPPYAPSDNPLSQSYYLTIEEVGANRPTTGSGTVSSHRTNGLASTLDGMPQETSDEAKLEMYAGEMTVHSHRPCQRSTRHTFTDTDVNSGIDNPAFIPEFQEQHM